MYGTKECLRYHLGNCLKFNIDKKKSSWQQNNKVNLNINSNKG